jgi:two-component system CheB/CheR fusion protein
MGSGNSGLGGGGMHSKDKEQTIEAAKDNLKEEKDIAKEIEPGNPSAFPIVGIGASAGGLEALYQLFSAMPHKTGMAFIIIQHSSPDIPTLLPGLLQKYTRMQITVARDGTDIEPDHVNIVPSDKNMQLVDHTLTLFAKPEKPYVPHSIDLFFRSMAENLKDQAIGIILSGIGSDGSFGSRMINYQLGMVIAQDPASAKHPDMPQSVIDLGVADKVLPPDRIPTYLMDYARKYFGKPAIEREEDLKQNRKELEEIFTLVKIRTDHDLSQFKHSTVRRRIERRMGIKGIDSVKGYVRYLRENPDEIESLFKEFIINVTGFFQDPVAFAYLKKYCLDFLKARPLSSTVRAWTLGCSTGEETYSVAFLLQECLAELKSEAVLRVFATDLDESAINLARTGLYPSSIITDEVAPERIDRFFDRKGSYYQVKKEIRQKCVFTQLDFIKAPSFSNIDLVSSRSILIYLNAAAHRRLIPILYSILNPRGLVFLGARDSMGQFSQLFKPLDPAHKIYQRLL